MKGIELKQIRKNLGFTQEQMAKKMGMSTRAYQKHEYSESVPNNVRLIAEKVHHDFDSMNGAIFSEQKSNAPNGNIIQIYDNLIQEKERTIQLLMKENYNLNNEFHLRMKAIESRLSDIIVKISKESYH